MYLKTAIALALILSCQHLLAFRYFEAIEGKESPYTKKIIALGKDLKELKKFCKASTMPNQVHQILVKTNESGYYIGLKKCMIIDAPLANVLKVKEDIAGYPELFPGLASVKISDKIENKLILTWERKSPVAIAGNLVYQIGYILDDYTSGSVLTRYQFIGGDRLRYVDGIELLEAQGNKTLFVNYDFNDANYSVLGFNVVGAESVQKGNYEGSLISILALKIKSENPDWEYTRVLTEAKTIMDSMYKGTYEVEPEDFPVPPKTEPTK